MIRYSIIETPNATVIDVNDANPSGQLLRFLHDTLERKPIVIVLKSYSPASAAVGHVSQWLSRSFAGKA